MTQTPADTVNLNVRELPGELVRRAKSTAALKGVTLKEFVIEMLEKAVKNGGSK